MNAIYQCTICLLEFEIIVEPHNDEALEQLIADGKSLLPDFECPLCGELAEKQ